jgi:hypothetical protein
MKQIATVIYGTVRFTDSVDSVRAQVAAPVTGAACDAGLFTAQRMLALNAGT